MKSQKLKTPPCVLLSLVFTSRKISSPYKPYVRLTQKQLKCENCHEVTEKETCVSLERDTSSTKKGVSSIKGKEE
ncbi:unnamed protein product [Lactuca virosa]|uniref:Uncharacterized protein n=1 Tax=Lactuca virosa TaxID=75947 RepID=A0AAU9LG64_9ASTR|nr:unnamed protein product [Lactuca virosa]